jgi:hypothetical protein
MKSTRGRTYELATRLLAVPVALCGLWYAARGFKRTINRGAWPRGEAIGAFVCFGLAFLMARGRRGRSDLPPRP